MSMTFLHENTGEVLPKFSAGIGGMLPKFPVDISDWLSHTSAAIS
jgi:hypothetical protein